MPAVQEARLQPLGREGSLEKGMAAGSVFLLGEVHAQRSLAGYSSWDQRESDTTEQLTHTHGDGDRSRRTSSSGCHTGRCRYTYFIPESSVNSASLEYQESLGWQTTDLIGLNNDLNYLLQKPSCSKGLCVF